MFGTTDDADLRLAGKMNLPLVSRLPAEYGPPSISINGPDGAYSVFDLQRQIGPRIAQTDFMQFSDTLSWQRGKHFLRFGTEIQNRLVTFQQARDPRGSFGFDGTYTGSALADLHARLCQDGRHQSDPHQHRPARPDPGVLRPGRLESDAPPDHQFRPALGLFRAVHAIGRSLRRCLPERLCPWRRRHSAEFAIWTGIVAADKRDFGPRFGFAYRPALPGGDWVMRGGYGIYYTPEISNAIFAMAEGAQATAGASVTGNLTGAPNIFLSDPFSSAIGAAPARCRSR